MNISGHSKKEERKISVEAIIFLCSSENAARYVINHGSPPGEDKDLSYISLSLVMTWMSPLGIASVVGYCRSEKQVRFGSTL